MILADSSAWIEYDRATGSRVHRRVAELVAAPGLLAFSEPVLMEVLAGAHTDRRESALRRLLQRFQLLSFETQTDFDGAARIYRRCRAAGVTPRGIVDCMIAAVALRTSSSLLACDADIARVAGVMGIELDEASLAV